MKLGEVKLKCRSTPYKRLWREVRQSLRRLLFSHEDHSEGHCPICATGGTTVSKGGNIPPQFPKEIFQNYNSVYIGKFVPTRSKR